MKIVIALLLFIFSSNSLYCGQQLKFARIENLAEQKVAEKLLRHIYKRLGFEISVEALPGRRANVECLAGNFDGETARIFSYGEHNPSLIRIPTPYSTLETTAFSLKSRMISIKSKRDLEKYKIVIIRGVQHTIDITNGIRDVTLMHDCPSMMKFIESGRADVALTNSLNGICAIQKLNRHDIELAGNLETLNLYHYVTRKNAHLVAKIDKIIQDMVNSGEMEQLRRRFENDYILDTHEQSMP